MDDGGLSFFEKKINNGMNIYDQLNCSFVGYNLNLMYRAMWDLAWETNILCALSCCISFFGVIAVYSFLWVMYLWRRDDNDYKSFHKIKTDNNIFNKNKNKKTKIIAPPKEIDDEKSVESA